LSTPPGEPPTEPRANRTGVESRHTGAAARQTDEERYEPFARSRAPPRAGPLPGGATTATRRRAPSLPAWENARKRDGGAPRQQTRPGSAELPGQRARRPRFRSGRSGPLVAGRCSDNLPSTPLHIRDVASIALPSRLATTRLACLVHGTLARGIWSDISGEFRKAMTSDRLARVHRRPIEPNHPGNVHGRRGRCARRPSGRARSNRVLAGERMRGRTPECTEAF
jgi:hypothetical protein